MALSDSLTLEQLQRALESGRNFHEQQKARQAEAEASLIDAQASFISAKLFVDASGMAVASLERQLNDRLVAVTDKLNGPWDLSSQNNSETEH